MFTTSTFFFSCKYISKASILSNCCRVGGRGHRIVGYFASQFRRKTESQVKSSFAVVQHRRPKHTGWWTTPPSWAPHCHVNSSKQKDHREEKDDYLSQQKLMRTVVLFEDSQEGTQSGLKVSGHSRASR